MPADFVQVDAFIRRPLHGNPAAVVFDADEIPTEAMQKIAREMKGAREREGETLRVRIGGEAAVFASGRLFV